MGKPEEFLPKKGNYRGLPVYQKTGCIHDITFYFAHTYMFERNDGTVNQTIPSTCSGMKELLADHKGLKGVMRPMRLMGLIGLIGIIGIMGCSPESSTEEMVEPVSGTAICFSGQQGEEQTVTRAGTPLSEAGITAFTVWGYKNSNSYSTVQTVFPGYTVNWQESRTASTTTNSSGWEYILASQPEQTIKYWDWSAEAYRFFGVTNYGGEDTGTYESNMTYGTYKTNGANRTYEITMEVDVSSNGAAGGTPYFSTLWFSTGNIVDYPTREFGKPVQLVFVKPYAKVRFMFTYVHPREGVVLDVSGFKPTDYSSIAVKGNVTISYPLTGTATKESYSLTSATGEGSGALLAFKEYYDPDDISKIYTKTDNGWYSVLPNNSQGSYTLTVFVNSTERTCTVPAAYMQWLPGYSYTYIFKINEEGGVDIDMVQSAFTGWTTDISATHTVYNW